GKSLAFDEDAVQGLLKLQYGDKNCFPLLSLIYPGWDSSRRHVDHVYPQALFTRTRLGKLGFTSDAIAELIPDAQEIPNLQLLTPAENESKGGSLPGAWLTKAFPNEHERSVIQTLHHLGVLSDDLHDFNRFMDQRRAKLADVIRERLGVSA